MSLSCYWQWISSSHCQSSLRIHSYFDNVMTKFMINNRTDAWKTDVNLLNRHVCVATGCFRTCFGITEILQFAKTKFSLDSCLKIFFWVYNRRKHEICIYSLPSRSNRDVKSHVSCVGAEVIGFRKDLQNDLADVRLLYMYITVYSFERQRRSNSNQNVLITRSSLHDSYYSMSLFFISALRYSRTC